MRSTGPTADVRDQVAERSAGLCERCGQEWAAQIHHRRPRGAGGSRLPDTNSLSNLLHICAQCHAWIESFREQALALGWLVRQGNSPAEIPVSYRGELRWLQPDGGVDYHAADAV
ncbi:HNH endonuclease [Nocardia sp. NPDC051052]|uniref:HNH endonuclease n=1 Tax=Nocardia sp. NPDC051052 TaxID=3364322 RepID=UPI0037986620